MNLPFPLEQLQDAAVNRLLSDAMFDGSQSTNNAPIPIITELKGDILTEITLAVDKLGICILVLTPVFRLHTPQIPSLDGYAHLMISVFENVVLNQTKIRSVSVAQNVLGLMHFWATGVPAGNGSEAVFMSDERQEAIILTNEGPPLQYSVPLQARVIIARPS
jgi:hypothetical protein